MSADYDEVTPEQDLRLTQESLEDLYEQAPCGYCSCLPDGTLVKLNGTLLNWLGYRWEELVARRCLQDLLSIGSRLHYETHCAPLLLLQGHLREVSYQLRRHDGTGLPVLLNAVLLRDAEGQPLVVRVTLFDITERRKYEQELLRAKGEAEAQRELLALANTELETRNAELLRINQDLDNFVYTASHDLKQPLHNMAGLFAELKRTAIFPDPDAEHMIHMFEGALEQIQTTIQELTEVVQMQRQLEKVPAEPIELRPFTEDIIRSLALAPNVATPRFSLDFGARPTVMLPRPALHSILYNLISNAVKYAHPGRRAHVRVSSASAGDDVVLTVQDNGLGMDLERHGRELFQLFRRFHPEVPGSGVGLYLVQRLIHQLGGRVEAESTVGAGSIFRVFLPTR